MKKFLFTALFLLVSSTAFALDVSVGIYGGKVNYDETLYSVDTSPAGASISVNQDIGNTPFFVTLEAVGTEHALSPSAGIGVKIGDIKVSAGFSVDNEERATYVFGNGYSDGNSTDEFTSQYVEVSAYNIFVRYSEYDVEHTFVGAKYDNAPLTEVVSTNNAVIQAGYRFTF